MLINETNLMLRQGRIRLRRRIYELLQIVSLVIVSWLLVIPAYAVGISVSPPSLELRGTPNKKITGTFTVTNPSRETVVYEITNDGLLTLAITPTTFLLEPATSAKVTVEYDSPAQRLTNSRTNLSILGRPLTVQPTQAASGVKLPVSISTGQVAGASTHRFDLSILGIVLLDIFLLGWLSHLLIRRLHRPARAP